MFVLFLKVFLLFLTLFILFLTVFILFLKVKLVKVFLQFLKVFIQFLKVFLLFLTVFYSISGLADCFSDILAGGGSEKCLLYVANVLYCKWRPLLFCMQQSGDKENIRLYLYKYTILFTCIQG